MQDRAIQQLMAEQDKLQTQSQEAETAAKEWQRQLEVAGGRITDLLKAQDRAKRAAELKANEFSAVNGSLTAELESLKVSN